MAADAASRFYNDLNIHFCMEGADFYALKISFERFERSIPSHSHSSNSYEIHYIPYGYGNITLDHQAHTVAPDTLYVTGPFVEHSQTPAKREPMAEYCVYLKTPARARGNPASVAAVFQNTPQWFGRDSQHLHAIMRQIFEELSHQYTGYIIQVETLLQQLIVGMVRNYEGDRASTVHFASASLADSNYLIIEESFLYDFREITLQKLAGRLGLSARQTERLLRRHYGKTFVQKKAEAKMSAASFLLRDSTHSIARIAEDLGYSSEEHFSYAFRRYYRVSAGEYRKTVGRAPEH